MKAGEKFIGAESPILLIYRLIEPNGSFNF
jgi:hypothetical protein